MKNILFIRLKSMGDVVLTLPAVHAVRNNFPGAKITYLTSKENAELLRGFREVNEIIAIDRAMLRGGNPLKVIPEFIGLLYRLRAGKFDLVVDLHGCGETGWLARVTGAPHRWGLIFKDGRGWAYTRKIRHDSHMHAADWHLRMLEQCGLKIGEICNDFVLPESATDDARAWFAEHQFDTAKPTIYVQPFTSGSHKNWPLENYLAVAGYWKTAGMQIILGGGPADRAVMEPLRRGGWAVSAGVPLLVTAGLMQLSTLVLGGDTGALHLAVAQGKRVVMLISHNNPDAPVPFNHPEWAVVPGPGGSIPVIETSAVITACARAMEKSCRI
jgi:ADP-heptose:LPS heptosyltransferase